MKWRYPIAGGSTKDDCKFPHRRVSGPALGWVGFAIALGVVLRVVPYCRNRSLWYDEALLALNILHRPFSGLFDVLDYHQGAPVGFLLLEKFVTRIVGGSELALRFVPLLLGVGAMFLLLNLARACISARAVALAALLFAVNEPLIYYSSEVKQYSCDVAITLLMLWVILRFLQSEMSVASTFELGLLGALTIWFSHPVSFLLAGSAVPLVLIVWRRRPSHLFRITCAIFLWGISFALFYFLSLRRLGEDRILIDFWRNFFPPIPPWSQETPQWLFARGLAILGDSRSPATVLSAAMFAAGCGALIQKKKAAFLWLICGTGGMTLFASYLHKYPLADRLLLFAVPIALLCVAEGTVWLADTIFRSQAVRVGLIVLVLANPVWLAMRSIIAPNRPDDIRPAIDHILVHQREGDALYVYSQARRQFQYYADLRNVSVGNVHFGADCGVIPSCYEADLESLHRPSRVWILLSHILINGQTDEEQIILAQLDAMGVRLDEKRSPGARAYLYDLSTGAKTISKPALPQP